MEHNQDSATESPQQTSSVLRTGYSVLLPKEANIAKSQSYIVYIDDNFHYMDSSKRIVHGEFGSIGAAVEACKRIVIDCLASHYKPHMTAEALYSLYVSFGDDPWVSGATGVPYSAWEHAKRRCHELCDCAA